MVTVMPMVRRLLYQLRSEPGPWKRYLKTPCHRFGQPMGIWAAEEEPDKLGLVRINWLLSDGQRVTYLVTLAGAQDNHNRARRQFGWRLTTVADWNLSLSRVRPKSGE